MLSTGYEKAMKASQMTDFGDRGSLCKEGLPVFDRWQPKSVCCGD